MAGPDRRTATVYYSTTGERFHGVPDCPAYELGRSAWDSDDPPPGFPSSPVFLQRTVAAAMGAGKLPCTVCLPGLCAAWFQGTCEEDFGHEPIVDPIGRLVCARCATRVRQFRWDVDGEVFTGRTFLRVLWPCTSAVILGLAPRTEGA